MNIKKSNHSSNGNGHKISVMLVDGDLAFLRNTKTLLHTHYGDKIDVVGIATSGEECIKLAQLFAPQVVLMDFKMSDRDGLEIISLLHILFPEMRVIALTFDDQKESRRAVLAAGGSDLISKTEMKTYLFPAIEEAMMQDPIDTVMMPMTV